jgi:phosphoribosyl 1,2-cyclic phosphodiesterase
MKVHVLASGSTGNAILLQTGSVSWLVDAGISLQAMTAGLAEAGVNAADLAGIFITHEHTDHVKGLVPLVRKHQLPVFARYKTWQAMSVGHQIPDLYRHILDDFFRWNNIDIEFFPVSHDAADPIGFAFSSQDQKAVVMTDLGQVDYHLLEAAAYADIIVLESNFDPDLLTAGPYPLFLKRRIRGPKGHLSNQEAGIFLCQMLKKSHLKVLLAHLSQNNNTVPLAKFTVSQLLFEQGPDTYNQVSIYPTYPQKTVSISAY